LNKPEVREIARQSGLALADKPDSQEICFIPGGDYKQFITNYLEEQGQTVPESGGQLVSTSGVTIGKHEGIHNFTIGQRKGLGVTSPNPLYVLNIDSASRNVTVGPESELNRNSFTCTRANWISISALEGRLRVQARIRHSQSPAPAWIEPTVTADGVKGVLVTFDEPQRAVTPGHSAVFYDGDEVVGGGWIA
jgi:tRNA-specific 2-thiouridylase